MGMIPGMKVRVLAALLATLAAVPAFAAPTVTAGVGVSGIQVGTVPALARRLGTWDRWGISPSSADMALRRYLRDGADMGGDRLATLIAEVGIEVVPAKGRWT